MLDMQYNVSFPLCAQAQLIAQSIGQAFSVAYQEFLRANGINPEDLSQKEYSDLLNTQDMYNDDLIHFSKSENCKDVSGQSMPGGNKITVKFWEFASIMSEWSVMLSISGFSSEKSDVCVCVCVHYRFT